MCVTSFLKVFYPPCLINENQEFSLLLLLILLGYYYASKQSPTGVAHLTWRVWRSAPDITHVAGCTSIRPPIMRPADHASYQICTLTIIHSMIMYELWAPLLRAPPAKRSYRLCALPIMHWNYLSMVDVTFSVLLLLKYPHMILTMNDALKKSAHWLYAIMVVSALLVCALVVCALGLWNIPCC